MSVHDTDEHSAGGLSAGAAVRPPVQRLRRIAGSTGWPGWAGSGHGGLGRSAGCRVADGRGGQYGHLRRDLVPPVPGGDRGG